MNNSPATYTNDFPEEVRLAINLDLERLTAKYTTAQTDAVLKTVPTSKRFVVLEVDVLVENATSVDVQCVLEFDSASDVKIVEHPGIAPGSGFVLGDGGHALAVGGDGENLLVTATLPTNGSLAVHVTGYLTEA
jgi:hypothetical protein